MSRVRTIASVSGSFSRRAAAIRGFSQLSQYQIFLRPTTPKGTFTVPRRSYVISTEGTHIEHLIDQVSDTQYNQIANEYLETLSDDMEELGDAFPQVDVELTQGVMTLTIASGRTYVINKQPPNKQIWLSSPYSGPKRYDLIGGKWVTLRDNSSLTDLLRTELEEEFGQEVSLTMNQ